MKHYKVTLSPDAISDLISIYNHIADESNAPEIGLGYIKKLEKKCYRLDIAPVRGQVRDDIRENLRIIPIDKNALAAFEIDEERKIVTILNIFYGGRDYETIMNQ